MRSINTNFQQALQNGLWLKLFIFSLLFFLILPEAFSFSDNNDSNEEQERTPLIEVEYPKKKRLFRYSGLEVSLGSKVAGINSREIDKLRNTELVKGGGTLGFYFGNDYVKFPVRVLGLYTEAIKDDYSTDFYEASVDANINLLKIAGISSRRLSSYVIVGLSHSTASFYGTYVKPEFRQAPKGGRMEPLIGKIHNNYLNTGWGMEYNITPGYDFISIFMEAKSMMALSGNTNYEILENTFITRNMSINFGVRIGTSRR